VESEGRDVAVRLPQRDKIRGNPGLAGKFVGISIQLWTNKGNKLIISGTRFFGKKPMTDLKPDGQKELKNGVFMLFPRFLAAPTFLSKNFDLYHVYKWLNLRPQDLGFGNPSNRGCRVHQDVNIRVNGHHDCLIDCPVLLLLAHSPCSNGTCQTLAVSTHKPPGSVYETLYNFLWTFFKEALCRFLGILEGFLLHLPITVFAQPQY
jgi:hypothetical protein